MRRLLTALVLAVPIFTSCTMLAVKNEKSLVGYFEAREQRLAYYWPKLESSPESAQLAQAIYQNLFDTSEQEAVDAIPIFHSQEAIRHVIWGAIDVALVPHPSPRDLADAAERQARLGIIPLASKGKTDLEPQVIYAVIRLDNFHLATRYLLGWLWTDQGDAVLRRLLYVPHADTVAP